MTNRHVHIADFERYVADELDNKTTSELEQHVADCMICGEALSRTAREHMALAEVAQAGANQSVLPNPRPAVRIAVPAALVAAAAALVLYLLPAMSERTDSHAVTTNRVKAHGLDALQHVPSSAHASAARTRDPACAQVVVDHGFPQAWYMSGSSPGDYGKRVHPGQRCPSQSSAALHSTSKPYGFGTLMQKVDAVPYRGARVRLSARIKTQDVAGWSGLWMRVDGPSSQKMLAFDNMGDRPIAGTTPWTQYEVVLDVADVAQGVAFGVLLDGDGVVWIESVSLQIVDRAVATTGAEMQ